MTAVKTAHPALRRALTMDDIARLAQVDKSTVSRALAGNQLVSAETRQHVRKIAEKHGYVVNSIASGLRSRKTKVIAVAVPLGHDANQPLSDPFFLVMVGHLADRLAEQGYDLLLSKVPAPNASWISALYQSRRADGVVLIGQSLEHDHISTAASMGIPLVVWGAQMKNQNYISVGTNNRVGAKMATAHLIERGRRRIAFIGDTRLPEIAQRFEGYVSALRGAGLELDERRVASSNFEPDDAFKASTRLLQRLPDTDGIVAASDVIAIASMAASDASDRKVPSDISVVGFDDIAVASHTSPSLTTIRQDIARGSALLAQSILSRIDGKPVKSVEMKPVLIVRNST